VATKKTCSGEDRTSAIPFFPPLFLFLFLFFFFLQRWAWERNESRRFSGPSQPDEQGSTATALQSLCDKEQTLLAPRRARRRECNKPQTKQMASAPHCEQFTAVAVHLQFRMTNMKAIRRDSTADLQAVSATPTTVSTFALRMWHHRLSQGRAVTN